MKLLKEIHKRESGQAMVLALVLMLVGGVIIAPLMSYMGSGLKAGQVYEGKMDKLYAADAGVEDTINKIVKDYPALENLHEGEHYHLPSISVNSQQVNVKVTKLDVMEGLLGEEGGGGGGGGQGEENRVTVTCDVTQTTPGQGWVEYTCHVSLHYNENGSCDLESAGAFFSPFPGAASLISGPYGWEGMGNGTMTGFMTLSKLEAPPQSKIVPGGFAFIWRWADYPGFDKWNRDGAFDFKFKIYSLDWKYAFKFAWGDFQQWGNEDDQTSLPSNAAKWLIETWYTDPTKIEVRSAIIEAKDEAGNSTVAILTWEINPQH